MCYTFYMNSEDKKDIEALVRKLSNTSDKKLAKLSEKSDAKIEQLKKESTEETSGLIERLKKESDKEMKHYIGGLMEQYKWDMAAILENTKGQQAANEKIDIMFENMGKQEVDIAILKETVLSHKQKFNQLGI